MIERLPPPPALENATRYPERAEDWARGAGAGAYDVGHRPGARAARRPGEYAAPLLRETGRWWRGRARATRGGGAARRGGGQLGLDARGVRHVAPFAGARDRHLHVLRKVGPTPDRFPRRAGQARKRPLA